MNLKICQKSTGDAVNPFSKQKARLSQSEQPWLLFSVILSVLYQCGILQIVFLFSVDVKIQAEQECKDRDKL